MRRQNICNQLVFTYWSTYFIYFKTSKKPLFFNGFLKALKCIRFSFAQNHMMDCSSRQGGPLRATIVKKISRNFESHVYVIVIPCLWDSSISPKLPQNQKSHFGVNLENSISYKNIWEIMYSGVEKNDEMRAP